MGFHGVIEGCLVQSNNLCRSDLKPRPRPGPAALPQMCWLCCRVKEALGGAKHPVRVLQLDPEAPARHIAFCSPSDSKDSALASKDRPFLGAAISTDRLLYYVVFKEDGSEPGEHCLHNLLL